MKINFSYYITITEERFHCIQKKIIDYGYTTRDISVSI
jgi:hypothetical protein